jgi:hypothetical protein
MAWEFKVYSPVRRLGIKFNEMVWGLSFVISFIVTLEHVQNRLMPSKPDNFPEAVAKTILTQGVAAEFGLHEAAYLAGSILGRELSEGVMSRYERTMTYMYNKMTAGVVNPQPAAQNAAARNLHRQY